MRKKPVWMAVAVIGLAMTFSATAKHGDKPHWGYTGKVGAAQWGKLESDFATCALGKEQSPIDIRGAAKAELPEIGFAYSAGAAEVLNNGHTIQVNLASGGSVKLASGSYQLLQFHFHTPSEEKVNGKAYPLVAHMVHRNEEGKLAVVAVLFKLGKANPELAKIFAAMPAKAEEKVGLSDGFDPTKLLPDTRAYYAFTGSLTTPPCSEGVRWQVLKTPVELSKAQLAAFKKLYPMNARPVQPLNGRSLQVSE